MKHSGLMLFPTLSVLAMAGLPPYLASRATHAPQMQDNLPLRFEREGGQYTARGPGFVFSVSGTEWKIAGVRTHLAGANSGAAMEPMQRLPGAVNYFLGGKSSWRSDIEAWEGVRCRDAYPGIDLVFHGNARRLEYDFVVKAHSDPGLIRMESSGQRRLGIDSNGDLVVSTGGGEIRWKHPDLYQEIDGVRRRVEGKFVLAGRRTVRFETGAYDRSRDLVIDPTLAYSTYLGGNGNDTARGVAVDASGNVYIAGVTSSTNLAVLSAFQPAHGAQPADALGDVFVAKFNAAGALVYLTYLGGSGDDVGMAIAVDGSGSAYVVGYTTSADFPIAGTAPLQPHYGGTGGQVWYHRGDAFITKLSPAGNQLVYSTYLGGSADDSAAAIVVDSLGDAYVAGATASPNFPTIQGEYQASLRGAGGEPIEPAKGYPFIDPGDAFMVELNPAGSKLLLSTLVGGTSDDAATTIALDSAKNIYIAGYTMSDDFPTTQGALQRNWGGFDQQTPYFVTGDGFLTKLNSTATALVYSTFFGGQGDECITSIVTDSTGALYFTGWSSTTNLPTTSGAVQPKYAGYNILPFVVEYNFGDAIVGKLNPAGSQLAYLTYLGGEANDGGMAIAIDSVGDAFVAGFTDSANFPTTSGAYQTAWAGDGGPTPPYLNFGDGFLAMLNPNGSSLVYSTFIGGSRDDELYGLALDGTGKAYVVGNTYSPNWKVTANAAQSAYGGQLNEPEWPYGDAVYSVFSGFPITPVVSRVSNAEGGGAAIAANTWVEIDGSGLAPDTRPWQGSDFVNGQLPTALDGASVTLNGVKAYTYYISPTQINILTPAALAPGPVQVVVTNQGAPSVAFAATAQEYSTSFFVFNGGPYVAATHLNGSLIGPTTLYPGASTPAAPGETIVMYGNGFGAVTPPVVNGSETQTGVLPTMPTILIGTNKATVTFAGLVSPGLYQFNVMVPTAATGGDNTITGSFYSNQTQAGTLITIQ
ncbi:MAG: SBBP repeat-containing protein [Bryobacteraceae bacterium]